MRESTRARLCPGIGDGERTAYDSVHLAGRGEHSFQEWCITSKEARREDVARVVSFNRRRGANNAGTGTERAAWGPTRASIGKGSVLILTHFSFCLLARLAPPLVASSFPPVRSRASSPTAPFAGPILRQGPVRHLERERFIDSRVTLCLWILLACSPTVP